MLIRRQASFLAISFITTVIASSIAACSTVSSEYDDALTAMNNHRPQEAIEHTRRALALNADNVHALYLESTAYLALCANDTSSSDCRLDLAELDARRAVAFDDGYFDAKNLLGQVYIDEKKYDDAIRILKPLTQDERYHFPYLSWGNLGWAQVLSGDVDAGIESLTTSLSSKTNFCTGYYRRGVAYEKKLELEKAARDFNSALRASPECRSFREAQGGLARVTKSIPGGLAGALETREVAARISGGETLCRAGDADSCAEVYGLLIGKYPHDVVVFFSDICGMDSSRPHTLLAAKACNWAMTAQSQAPGDVEIQERLEGYTCGAFGEFADPRDAANKAQSEVNRNDKSGEQPGGWQDIQTMRGVGNIGCVLIGMSMQMKEDDARNKVELAALQEEQARQEREGNRRLAGIFAAGAGSIANTVSAGTRQVAAARRGVAPPPQQAAGGPGGISGGAGGGAGGANGDPNSPACSACSSNCSPQIQSCKAGGQKACYLAAACLCQCNENAGGCGTPAAALANCVSQNQASAASLNSPAGTAVP